MATFLCVGEVAVAGFVAYARLYSDRELQEYGWSMAVVIRPRCSQQPLVPQYLNIPQNGSETPDL